MDCEYFQFKANGCMPTPNVSVRPPMSKHKPVASSLPTSRFSKSHEHPHSD